MGLGHHLTVLTVQNRDRTPPIALARYQPVAQAILGATHGAAFAFKAGGDSVKSLPEIEAIVLAAVHQQAVLDVGLLVDVDRAAVGRTHHLAYRQVVTFGEFVVALVVGRHRHHGARAITHQHEVRDPHRQRCAGEGVIDCDAERQSALLHGLHEGLGGRLALAGLEQLGDG